MHGHEAEVDESGGYPDLIEGRDMWEKVRGNRDLMGGGKSQSVQKTLREESVYM